ncbi:MucBP domain-containing protein [Fusibacter sp. JL298sf-3]
MRFVYKNLFLLTCLLLMLGTTVFATNDAGDVVVFHLSEDGDVLAPPVVMNGPIGDAYYAVALDFEGYGPGQMPENAVGFYGHDSVRVEIRYRPLTVTSSDTYVTEESLSDTYVTEESLSDTYVTEESLSAPTLTDEDIPLSDALPQTGHAPAGIAFGIGCGLLLLGAYLRR